MDKLFEWLIDEALYWPPVDRPRPPLGPTQIDVARSCSLRSCFEYSSGYERRMLFEGRIGSAFHSVLESLSTDPISSGTPDAIAGLVRQRFTEALQRQVAEADRRPREASLPRDSPRTNLAVMALIETAQVMARSAVVVPHRPSPQGPIDPAVFKLSSDLHLPLMSEVAVEFPIASPDGLFRGRIDRIERTELGVRIIDYKSSVRDELPERYARQVQLYAALWFDVYGVWPVEGEIIFPLVSKSYLVPVEPATCQAVRDEATVVITRLQHESDTEQLAQPGEVCRICEFRPWCRSFWSWQSAEPKRSIALERATWGFEGKIETLATISQHWKLQVRWQNALIDVVVPVERFPHLNKATTGTHVRIIDARLQGLRHQPRAVTTPETEIWLVKA